MSDDPRHPHLSDGYYSSDGETPPPVDAPKPKPGRKPAAAKE